MRKKILLTVKVTILLQKKDASGNFETKARLEKMKWCKVSEYAKTNEFLKSILKVYGETDLIKYIYDICDKIGIIGAHNVTVGENIVLE